MRRITDTEVRLLSNLIMRVEDNALLGPLDRQHKVFRLYWPLASAHSFRALTSGMELAGSTMPSASRPKAARATTDVVSPGLESPLEVASELAAAKVTEPAA